jgi:glycosyltransferase involved in cell wall biosynthesis
MDVFALTSRSEGMPLAILEAWAAKLPVIASDAGGIPDIVCPHVNGLLFPSGDRMALINSLNSMLKDSKLRERIAAQGHSNVRDNYSLSRMVSGYRELYRAQPHPNTYLAVPSFLAHLS